MKRNGTKRKVSTAKATVQWTAVTAVNCVNPWHLQVRAEPAPAILNMVTCGRSLAEL